MVDINKLQDSVRSKVRSQQDKIRSEIGNINNDHDEYYGILNDHENDEPILFEGKDVRSLDDYERLRWVNFTCEKFEARLKDSLEEFIAIQKDYNRARYFRKQLEDKNQKNIMKLLADAGCGMSEQFKDFEWQQKLRNPPEQKPITSTKDLKEKKND